MSSYVYHDEIQKNIIISQYPEQGEECQRGSSVNLLISLGKRPGDYLMANLSGMSIDEAVSYLEQNQLKVGKITSVSEKKSCLEHHYDPGTPGWFAGAGRQHGQPLYQQETGKRSKPCL